MNHSKALSYAVKGSVPEHLQAHAYQATYRYVVDLDERGCFAASVYNRNDKLVWQIRCETQEEHNDAPWSNWVGYMKHPRDTDGALAMLKQLGIATNNATILLEG